jgi:hypothetical protein
LFGCRDLAIAPFFGNSIASRLPPVPITVRGSRASRIEQGSSTAEELLWLGGFRAAQRVCLLLRLSSPIPQQQQQQQQQQAMQAMALPSDLAGGGSSCGTSSSSSSGSSDTVVKVWLVNTHLDHDAADIRSRQMRVSCGQQQQQPCQPLITSL